MTAPFTREKRFKTRSEAGTLAIASTIAEILSGPRVVVLRGDLGAGKTTLVKGWVEALGMGSADEVTSPTFTLVHEYMGGGKRLYHLDLYRVETEARVAALGIEEMAAESGAVVLVEWGEKFASVSERADAEVAMEHLEGNERSLWVRWRDQC